MAEAHSAVAFGFAISHDGWHINFDLEVLNLVWQSGIRSWKKRFFRFHNNIKAGVYPASLASLWLTLALVMALHFYSIKIPYDPVEELAPYLYEYKSYLFSHLTACLIVGLTVWLTVIHVIRYTLKMLLMYKGWMYEARGPGRRVSMTTRIWAMAVKIFSGWYKPMLYSFQGSLPRLPLPSVKDTMRRYLRSVRPLLDDENYARMERLAKEFQQGVGKKLQWYLVIKSWWSTNYVTDWWEEFVYLRGRSPIMVNSNFYAIDAIMIHPTTSQVARAASCISSCIQFRRLIERQELEPLLIQGMIPLCSWQYERLFNTTRIPGVETDKLVHLQDSKHVIVYHKGRYFKLPIYHKNRLLKACEIEMQIEWILEDESPPCEGEEKLASLTAGERAHWAKSRERFKGINKVSLDLIEKAAFVIALDDFPYEFDMNHPEKLDNYGRILLHGKGYDRWFDKSFTICVGSNGRIGFNAEHSWADAPIMANLWEFIIEENVMVGFKPDGRNLGTPEFNPPPPPSRLDWDLTPRILKDIEISYEVARELLTGLDLRIYVHDDYGKGLMKKCSMSPDAYIQMALQLAYYRDAGKFCQTYEASMTRLFREGRTETVRPCTIEAAAWVKAMESQDATLEEKLELLEAAAVQHQKGYQDAMCGKGIDRHLFCLYVISKYLEVDSPFLQEVLSEPWKLSTSQTPHGQRTVIDHKKYPNVISAGGGFGPVADDGYGVSYIIAGENMIFFHISSKFASPETDSKKFAHRIRDALADMKNLFVEKMKKLPELPQKDEKKRKKKWY